MTDRKTGMTLLQIGSLVDPSCDALYHLLWQQGAIFSLQETNLWCKIHKNGYNTLLTKKENVESDLTKADSIFSPHRGQRVHFQLIVNQLIESSFTCSSRILWIVVGALHTRRSSWGFCSWTPCHHSSFLSTPALIPSHSKLPLSVCFWAPPGGPGPWETRAQRAHNPILQEMVGMPGCIHSTNYSPTWLAQHLLASAIKPNMLMTFLCVIHGEAAQIRNVTDASTGKKPSL